MEKAEDSPRFNQYNELSPEPKKIIFKGLTKNHELDPVKSKGPWKLIRVSSSKESVSAILDNLKIGLYEVSDIREESGDTLMVLDVNLLPITDLQEKF